MLLADNSPDIAIARLPSLRLRRKEGKKKNLILILIFIYCTLPTKTICNPVVKNLIFVYA